MEKDRENIVRGAVIKLGTERARPDFSQLVMARVESQTETAPVLVTPATLISARGWALIGLIVSSLFAVVFLLESQEKITSFFHFDFSSLASYFSVFLSQLFVTGMVCAAGLISVYMLMISRKLNQWENHQALH